jgi:hypothetical protein
VVAAKERAEEGLCRSRYHARSFECRSCGHHIDVELHGIQAEHGDGFRVSGFVARARCSRCGARHLQVTIRVFPGYAPRVITHHRSE